MGKCTVMVTLSLLLWTVDTHCLFDMLCFALVFKRLVQYAFHIWALDDPYIKCILVACMQKVSPCVIHCNYHHCLKQVKHNSSTC
jgi:hypothetical protein